MSHDIPFAFALNHKAFYDAKIETLFYSRDAKLESIVELSRFLELPKKIKELDSVDFEKNLNDYYAESQGSAAQAMTEMDEYDLQDASLQIEKEGDLLENDNAAPIIRLLNSIFFEALKKKRLRYSH